ncbi:sensor histidine kinase [Flavobacterium caeni]|uniref:Histidine kinase n=1 Tax=Flavobacterium caeni TaxID=490189 RepID=A0A1G5HI65_9FLAO|nr:histidine kinase [Flavobacterium caeni]SCY63371.1 Histidine kinase [Flavobacterium caeni]
MRKRWVNHFLFWLLYTAFEIYTEFEWFLGQYHFSVARSIRVAVLAETLLVLAVKIPMVYVVFGVFERYGFSRQNRLRLIVWTSVALVVAAFLSRMLTVHFIYPEIYQLEPPRYFAEYQGLINAFMDIIFIAGIAIALKQHSVSNKLIRREKALQKEKLETELNFLKAQINPHFMFNTLNSIYALALKKSDDTPSVVVKLSELLRFVLYETQSRSIPIGREVEFLSGYIALEKMRYDERIDIDFNAKVDDNQTPIVPLLLVPLVENAFKHGGSETVARGFIRIDLVVGNGRLDFSVENSFEPGASPEKSGIGLANLRRQLELSYADFRLETSADGGTFGATLQLNLTSVL